MTEIPAKAKIYLAFVYSIGLASLIYGLVNYNGEAIPSILFFVLLGIVAESLPIFVNKQYTISVSSAISIAVILVFNSPVAIIIKFCSAILPIRKYNGKYYHILNQKAYKTLFNGTARAIIVFAALHTYQWISSVASGFMFQELNVFGILGMMLVYLALDKLIFGVLLHCLQGIKVMKFIKESIWTLGNLILISPLGIIIAIAYRDMGGAFPVLLFFGPLLLARFSFSLYLEAKNALNETIRALSNAMEAKDHYTNGHSHRVADVAVAIAKHMNLPDKSIEQLHTAALLHDIGKIGVEDIILNKAGKLEAVEFMKIEEHPEIGARILDQVQNLQKVAMMVRYHHVHFNGNGYPEVAKGDCVPIESYIISVSDAYDAMTSDRPYRKALTEDEALRRIHDGSGEQFHPDVAQALLSIKQFERELVSDVV